MFRYAVNLLVQLIPTIFGIYTIAFFLMLVLPGDTATVLIVFLENQEALENLRRVMKLDEPILNQYLAFLQGALRGDLGRSYLTGIPVTEMIAGAITATIALAVAAMTIAVIVGIPLGIVAALRHNSG